MTYKIEINCENEAFQDGKRQELARILKRLALLIESYNASLSGEEQKLFDFNGNCVGEAWMEINNPIKRR